MLAAGTLALADRTAFRHDWRRSDGARPRRAAGQARPSMPFLAHVVAQVEPRAHEAPGAAAYRQALTPRLRCGVCADMRI
ncbi:MAG: hypothetical protein AB7M12_03025 [Hyphomonadaceae bacterium]